MENAILPFGVRSVTSGMCAGRSMEKVSLSAGLLRVSFGNHFSQSMENVSLSAVLQSFNLHIAGWTTTL